MNKDDLFLEIPSQQEVYLPGDVISGTYHITPEVQHEIRAVEFSIRWFTEGHGDKDIGIHFFERWEKSGGFFPELKTPRPFSCPLPNSPLTYNGAVIGVKWHALLRALVPFSNYICTIEFQLGLLGDLPRAEPAKSEK